MDHWGVAYTTVMVPNDFSTLSESNKVSYTLWIPRITLYRDTGLFIWMFALLDCDSYFDGMSTAFTKHPPKYQIITQLADTEVA